MIFGCFEGVITILDGTNVYVQIILYILGATHISAIYAEPVYPVRTLMHITVIEVVTASTNYLKVPMIHSLKRMCMKLKETIQMMISL